MTAESTPGAGGLVLVGLEGPTLASAEAELLRLHDVAGVVLFRRNVVDADQLRDLCTSIESALGREEDRGRGAGCPPLIAADHEGGNVTALASAIGAPPSPLCLGIADDLELTRRVHHETARRARHVGVSLLLAPVADVVAVGNPVISTRAFGTAATSVGRHVRAALEGLRGGGALTCAKHWPGHGSPDVDSHFDVPTVHASLDAWSRRDLPPFLTAIEGGTDALMVGHLRIPALDASGRIATVSEPIVDDWLRRRLGFDGVIITDALEMGAFDDQRPADALRAGCDLLLFASPITTLSARLEALDEELRSRVPPPRIREAVDRVERLRRRAGGATDEHAGSGAIVAPSDVTAKGAAAPTEAPVYEEARRRGLVALGFAPRDLPWPPAAEGPVRWALVDAASGDRLVRAPGPGENPFEPGPGEGEPSLYLGPLEARLGPPVAAPLLCGPQGLGDVPVAPEGSPKAAGGLDGWIVASVRPLGQAERKALARHLLDAAPRWVALLGDLSLQTELPAEVSLVLVPGATLADAEILAATLTGGIPVAPQGRWGD